MDKVQVVNFWDTDEMHGRTVKEIEYNRASNDDYKQIVDILLRLTVAINRRERHIETIELQLNSSINLKDPKCLQQ